MLWTIFALFIVWLILATVYQTELVQEETLDQGWHVVAPWKRVTEYPVSTELAYYTLSNKKTLEKPVSISIY